MKTSAIARGYLPAAAVGFCCVMLTCAVVLADARAVTLYELFEKLNTPKNLRIRYVGGRPPHFITQQSALLRRLANGSPEKIVPFLTKIVDEFLVRYDALSIREVYASPLQALQLPLIQALTRHVESKACRERLAVLSRHKRFREFARGEAVCALTRYKLRSIAPQDDPNGTKRAKLLLDEILGKMSFAKMLHAPGRLIEIARASASLGQQDPVKIKAVFSGAVTLQHQYAADFAVIHAILVKVNGKKEITDGEKVIAGHIGRKYVQVFRLMVEGEKYASDVLGRAIVGLGGREGFEGLADILKEGGIKVPKYEPPPKPKKRGEKTPKTPARK